MQEMMKKHRVDLACEEELRWLYTERAKLESTIQVLYIDISHRVQSGITGAVKIKMSVGELGVSFPD